MLSRIRNLVLIALVGGCAFLFSPEPPQAVAQGGYWNNYWNWYDNTYRPYYNRTYRYNLYNNNPGYTYYTPGYGFPYNAYPYRGYGSYSAGYSPYYSRYYNNYYRGYYPRNVISLGDFQLSWR